MGSDSITNQRQKQFGKLVSGARERVGVNRELLGKLAGVSADSIENWEGAKKLKGFPDPANLAAVCNALRTKGLSAKEAREIFSFAYPEVFQGIERLVHGEQEDAWGADHLPHAWIRSNHSTSEISWITVGGVQRDEVIALAVKNYGKFFTSRPDLVQRPTHVTGSDIFRIAGSAGTGKDLFLKRFRHEDAAKDLASYLTIQNSIADRKIFRLSSHLRPVKTDSETDWVNEPAAVAYEFIQATLTGQISHFSGSRENELEQVGVGLAKINTALEDDNAVEQSPRGYVRDLSFWNEAMTRVHDAVAPTRGVYIARAEKLLIESAYQETAKLFQSAEDRYTRTLNDAHPHNVFTDAQGNCLLIFDYVVGSDWPECATAGFAAHRMCREFIRRRLRETTGAEVRTTQYSIHEERVAVESSANAFLKGYSQVRPNAAKEIIRDGGKWAKALNFQKLANVLAYLTGVKQDKYKRTEPQLFAECIKFVSYLNELEVFGKALADCEIRELSSK